MALSLSIVYDRLRWEEKTISKRALDKGIKVKLVDAKRVLLDSRYDGEVLRREFGDLVLQRCISYFRGFHLTSYLESKGLPVINRFDVALVCGNKLLTTLALEKAGVPTPRTILSFDPDSALRSAEKVGYPAVLKPVIGSWGRMISLLRDRETAQSIIEVRAQMSSPFSQIFYTQEMVRRPPRDIRAIVVGDEIVAAVYRHAPPGDWRTNVARGGWTTPCRLDSEQKEIVLRAAEAVGGGILGIDCMETGNGIVVHEVNSTVEFQGAASGGQVDIADSIVEYVRERMVG